MGSGIIGVAKRVGTRALVSPRDVLKDAQVKLGLNYPEPIVDHAVSRHEALSLYRSVKSGSRHVG